MSDKQNMTIRLYIALALLIIPLSSCQTSPQKQRSPALDQSCQSALASVVKGGRDNGPQFKYSKNGNSGGAYSANIELNGKTYDAIETLIYMRYVTDLPAAEYRRWMNLSLRAYELAAEKGIGPKVYGYKDEPTGLYPKRMIYLEKRGNILNFIPKLKSLDRASEGGLDVNVISFWRQVKTREEAQELLGHFYQDSLKEKPTLLDFLLGDSESANLNNKVNRINSIHPDPSGSNMILEFHLTKDKRLTGTAVGIDWNNPSDKLEERIRLVEDLEAFSLNDSP